jgi:hypothetical protein
MPRSERTADAATGPLHAPFSPVLRPTTFDRERVSHRPWHTHGTQDCRDQPQSVARRSGGAAGLGATSARCGARPQSCVLSAHHALPQAAGLPDPPTQEPSRSLVDIGLWAAPHHRRHRPTDATAGLVDGSHGVRPCSQALPPRVSNQSTHSTISLTPVPRRHGRVTRVSDSNVQVPKPTALARSSSGRSGIHELKEIVGRRTRAHSEPNNRTVIVRHQRQVVMGSSRLSDRSGRGVQGPTRRPRRQRSR